MHTLLVTDDLTSWKFANRFTTLINAFDYILDEKYSNAKQLRIINLCQDYRYQSLSYYVSLLAEARGHKIFPSVLTIQDVKNPALSFTISDAIADEIQAALKTIKSKEFILSVYFGKNLAKKYDDLCRKLHSLFPVPLFRVFFSYTKQNKWHIKKLIPIPITEVPESHRLFLELVACDYFAKKRFHTFRKKSIHYEMAILHNPTETTAPSNPAALKKFIDAAEELGIGAYLIDKNDFKSIPQYDALFIRETTAVNHYTYHFARCAASERLVVIDDPESILKCTNKVYLADVLKKRSLKTPETHIVSKHNIENIKHKIEFPCVIKQPDSQFSLGVVKVDNLKEFEDCVKQYLKGSDLIIVQSYLPTDFDWRIGIFNNVPLYACRYYMAKDHWQIYNWQSTSEKEGAYDAVPLSEVPPHVLSTAIKAAKSIGDGLYGIDLKESGGQIYVIEINDNPNIDHGVEDSVLGEKFYLNFMKIFLERINKVHGHDN